MTRHYTNCLDWGYDDHPDRPRVKARSLKIIDILLRNPKKFEKYKHDTRRGHKFMFHGLTPVGCNCIIGEYRGDVKCSSLAKFNVGVKADHRVGSPYYLVAKEIIDFENRCETLVKIHQHWKAVKGISQSPANALLKFVNVLSPILESFLRTHPYMDGNGHTARLLIYVMMVREGYPPRNWSIDDKQPYSDALTAYRDGKKGALQHFLLNAIA